MDKTFEDDCIVWFTQEQWATMATGVGHDRFREPTDNDRDVLPCVTFERFHEHLVEQTDLIEVHDSSHWDTVPVWRW